MKNFKLIVLAALTLICFNSYAQEPVSVDAKKESSPLVDYSNPKAYTINDITVHGVKFLNKDVLVSSAGLFKGQTVYIPSNTISQAVSKLWNQRYFSDVQVVADIIGEDKINLEIYLTERPRVYKWAFEGIRSGEASTLTEELKLKRGTELSDYVLDKNIKLIQKHFAGKGFGNTEVTTRLTNDSLIKNAVHVTFVVNKGPRVRIGKIEFDGNEEFTDKRLRRTMKKTHQKSINFFRNTKLNEANLEEDKGNIIDFYNSQGYRNAVILSDSIYTINEKRIGINITLDEGEKFYIRNISWVGNTKYPTELLNALLGIKQGDVYDRRTIEKRLGIGKEENPEDVTQIKSMYQNEGYLFSIIDPMEIVVGADSLDLEIKVFEGKPFTINNVSISGNMRVNDEVIRREVSTRPGELYNRALVMQTLRQLAQMGHFDVQSIMPDIKPVSNELVDISWPLVETASDKFEVSGGYGNGMFVFSVGIQLNNLSIGNVFKKKAWRPYPHGQNQQLIIRATSNGTYYKSFGLSFTEPWLGGKKPTSMTVSAQYSEETTARTIAGLVNKSNIYFRTAGAAVGIGRRLTLPDPYFSLYNEFGYQSYTLKDWPTQFIFSTGQSHIFTLKTVLARSTVNQPIYPSSGSDFSLSLTLTPPYSLFDGKDYKKISENNATSTTQDVSIYKWIEYHKWQGKFRWFLPLTKNNKLVLMLKAEMGYLGYYNKYKKSPFEGFAVGGDGMSGYNIYGVDVIGVRGYSDGDLTPLPPGYGTSSQTESTDGHYASLYNKYTVELRYPFLMQGQTQIYGLVFAEGGNGFNSWQEFDPFNLKRSLGVGVRLYLPIVGLIGFDWGYGFDNAYKSSKRHGGKFHFMMGIEF